MILQTQSLFSNHSIHSPILPITATRINSLSSSHHKHQSHSLVLPTTLPFPQFKPHNATLTCRHLRRPFCVLSSVASPSAPTESISTSNKPSPAEVSRTIMELSSVGTLSTLSPEGFPLGIGVRFAVEPEQGTPILCLNPSYFPSDSKSSLHVQLEQCGLRTPQCTIRGCLDKSKDASILKVSEANMIWVVRLGFDVRLNSPQNDVFEVRIPFPREVTDEKGAKSSFNCMSQLAWEMEKHYHAQDYKVN